MDDFDRMEKGKERGRITDRTDLVTGLIKWLVVPVRQKSRSVYCGFPVYARLRPYMEKIQSLTIFVFRRISSYTVTDIYNRIRSP